MGAGKSLAVQLPTQRGSRQVEYGPDSLASITRLPQSAARSQRCNRWPAVVLFFDPNKMPGAISWNCHFADGTLAPFGEYRVEAVACDIHDQCGSDKE